MLAGMVLIGIGAALAHPQLSGAMLALTPPDRAGMASAVTIVVSTCRHIAFKQIVRSIEKWYVDFDKCPSFFKQSHGCAICVAVCPWSRPGVGHSLVSKLARRSLWRRRLGSIALGLAKNLLADERQDQLLADRREARDHHFAIQPFDMIILGIA